MTRPSSYIGPADQYDYMGAMQFCNLFMLGMRSYNTLLDFGCGSLRLGRFAIQYLNRGNYYGIEARAALITEGIKLNHLQELIKAKSTQLRITNDCNLSAFKREFDYIIAQSVFTHMPKEQISLVLKSASRAMNRTSIFIANYKHGTKDYEGKQWTQQNITYTPFTMSHLIIQQGFVASPIHLIHTHLQTWLLIRK